mgnify:CR=1 FL=1
MSARPSMDGTRLIYEMQFVPPLLAILDIFVVTSHKGWKRKDILQLFLAETHAETIDSYLVL